MPRDHELRADHLSPTLRALIERGLLRLAMTEAGPRWLFIKAGLAGLRAHFLRQPPDFRTLFPRLHHQLGLGDLLDPGKPPI